MLFGLSIVDFSWAAHTLSLSLALALFNFAELFNSLCDDLIQICRSIIIIIMLFYIRFAFVFNSIVKMMCGVICVYEIFFYWFHWLRVLIQLSFRIFIENSFLFNCCWCCLILNTVKKDDDDKETKNNTRFSFDQPPYIVFIRLDWKYKLNWAERMNSPVSLRCCYTHACIALA